MNNENEIDGELIAKIVLDIMDMKKAILYLIPKKKEKLLKHLAASSIHQIICISK